MSNVFQRDLSLTPEASQARRMKGLETELEAPKFRPWVKNWAGTETAAGTAGGGTPITGVGEFTIQEPGMYFLAYSMDVGNVTAHFSFSFLELNGGRQTQAISGTNIGRYPHAGSVALLLKVGDVVRPSIVGEAVGATVAYFTSFQVMRVA